MHYDGKGRIDRSVWTQIRSIGAESCVRDEDHRLEIGKSERAARSRRLCMAERSVREAGSNARMLVWLRNSPHWKLYQLNTDQEERRGGPRLFSAQIRSQSLDRRCEPFGRLDQGGI
ncbi:hypothetical protein IE81DRAFT_340740, partial [Ceraceosorus guamensis]